MHIEKGPMVVNVMYVVNKFFFKWLNNYGIVFNSDLLLILDLFDYVNFLKFMLNF